MEDEYIHLISEPNGSKSEFSNKLAQEYLFPAEHKTFVALKEISFPRALKSQHIKRKSAAEEDKVRLGILVPYITGNQFREIEVEDGYYTAFDLVKVLNERFKAILGIQYETRTCRLVYNQNIDRIEIIINGEDSNLSHRVSLLIFPPLAIYLGLSKTKENFLFGSETSLLPSVKSKHKRHGIAKYSPLMKTFELIFIYLDIVKYQVMCVFELKILEF